MQAAQVGQFASWLQSSPFAQDRLFRRELEEISETEIQLFYARASLRGLKREAHDAIDQLQSELLLAAMDQSVPREALRLVAHEVPQDRYAVDEFIDDLLKLSPVRRLGVLMAVSCRIDVEQVVSLTWKEARDMHQLPALARDILNARSKVRHFKLPYVFWEVARENVIAPLVGLKAQAEAAFGAAWPAVQMRWTDMLWISGRSESGSFLGLVDEVAQGKL